MSTAIYYAKAGVIPVSSCEEYYLVSSKAKIQVNETAFFLWECLKKGITKEELISKAAQEFEMENTDDLEKDISSFLDSLLAMDMINILMKGTR